MRLPATSALQPPLARVRRFFSSPVRDVRAATLRVALIATAIVFLVYVVIAGAVMVIVNRNLTNDVDSRLASTISRLAGHPLQPPQGNSFTPPNQRLQEPLLIWTVSPDGDVASNFNEDLPANAHFVSSPTTVTLSDGNDVRIDGVSLGGGHLVVGQSLVNVTATQHNILAAELLVGPVLLVAVFLGALTIGRRTALPVERARQRQIELTADASHELRTPLSVIEAQTHLALERERDAAWFRSAFLRVDVESKRMRHLVDDLLWLARFDSTGAAPSAEAVDLGVLASQAASRFDAVAEARQLRLLVHVDPASTMVSAPPEWLDRLLGVLLDNACRYTPSAGLVEVRVGRRDHRVSLAVDDSGPGIPEHERAHIFDRFRRASDTPGGSGLGLAIAHAVVSASGGRWEIGTSGLGGASMAVSWPALIRGGPENAPMTIPETPAAQRADALLAPPPPPPQPA